MKTEFVQILVIRSNWLLIGATLIGGKVVKFEKSVRDLDEIKDLIGKGS